MYISENNQLEISCIVPAYENIALLSKCLMSILTQESVRAEVIVCDDSASQEVIDLVRFLAKRYPQLRYVNGPRSGNPVENWNKGLDEARADYCVVIHHDEFLVDSKYFRRALDKLELTGLPVVIGQSSIIGINRRSSFALVQRLMLTLKAPLWTLFAMNWIGSTAVVVFSRLNNPRFNVNLIWIVDIDFYYRLLAKIRKVEFLEGISVVSIGHHSTQISASCDYRALHLSELRQISSSVGIKPSVISCQILIIFIRLRKLLGLRR